MKTINLLIIALSLYSCSLIEEPEKFCEPELKEYLNTYIKESNQRGVNPRVDEYLIQFKSDLYVGSTKAAGSAMIKDGVVIIKIDIDWWNRSSDSDREVLFMHEAGHGFLEYDHYINEIMGTSKSKYKNYTVNREVMLDEFFKVE